MGGASSSPVFRPRTRLRPSRLLTIAHREKCVAYDEQNLEALADVFHSLPVQHERHRISSHDVDVSFLEREINLSLWLRPRPRGAGYACTVGWLKLREVSFGRLTAAAGKYQGTSQNLCVSRPHPSPHVHATLVN